MSLVRELQRIQVITIPDTSIGSQWKGNPAAGSGISLSLGKARAGDVAYAHSVQRNAASIVTAPSGWTQIAPQASAASQISTFMWQRVLDGTSADNLTLSSSAGSSPNTIFSVAVFRNADELNPTDAFISGIAQTWQSAAIPKMYAGGNLVTKTDNCVVILFQADITGSGVVPENTRTITSLDDEIVPEKFVDTTQGNSNACGMSMSIERRKDAGPVNRHQILIGNGSTQYPAHAYMIAIKPRLS